MKTLILIFLLQPYFSVNDTMLSHDSMMYFTFSDSGIADTDTFMICYRGECIEINNYIYLHNRNKAINELHAKKATRELWTLYPPYIFKLRIAGDTVNQNK